MTLDPVHVDGIARLARRVGQDADTGDSDAVAERAWTDFLDPLVVDGSAGLEPLGEQARHAVPVADAALQDRPFPTQHGLDAGTINPTTFKNGLVLDVSQAAMASVPSDIDLHRGRTVVLTAHTNDTSVDLDYDWRVYDGGYARRRVLHAPRVDRYEQTVVHALALYLAESEHAGQQADVVDDLLVLDGPIYPTGLLNWSERDPELQGLLAEEQAPRDVIGSYLGLVEQFADRGVPVAGFVKNSAAKAITRHLRTRIGAPWVNDDAFFRRVLERRDDDGHLQTDTLTFSNWFRSRLGTHRVPADPGALNLDHDRALESGAYDVTYFVIYDPRDDLLYRVEAPYAVTRDESVRRHLTDQMLAEVASERGPPRAVEKADSLASIDRAGKEALRERIEREFDTRQQRSYDSKRWGVVEDAV